MSSLLTNNSAMVALQTLKTINKNMGEVQNQISTGKRIANARDNAALWGISTTMKTDVSGFKAISESLSLGSATLSVGRDAAETISELLDTMKGKIVAAQEENVDRGKIQADVVALRDQILTVVDGAQFNGLNLLDGKDTVSILASLNRDAAGNVTPSKISFDKQNLTTDASLWNAAGSAIGGISKSTAAGGFLNQIGVTTTMTTVIDTATTGVAGTFRLRFTATDAVSGDVRTFDLQVASGGSGDVAADLVADIQAAANLSGNATQLQSLGVAVTSSGADLTITTTNAQENVTVAYVAGGSAGEAAPTFSTAGNLAAFAPAGLNAIQETATLTNRLVSEGDTYRISAAGTNYDYVARDGETVHDVAAQLVLKINGDTTNDLTARLGAVTDRDTDDAVIYISNTSGTTASGGAAVAYAGVSDRTDGVLGGGLEGLDLLDVTTADGATAALQAIERLIQASISAAADFGSSQGRIQTQSEFVSKLMDGLTSGIGTLVDADMEAASAKLQALQVQQQLGIQALSIANQQPQNILALFR